MAERIMKAVEFNKLSAKFRKLYKDEQSLYNAGWLLQPKYDGCYAEFHITRNTNGTLSCSANTRTDEPIRSVNHIIEQLLKLVDYSCVIVGELWCISDTVRFPEISGWVRRHYAAPDLHLMAFDILPPGLVTKTPYISRVHELYRVLPDTCGPVSTVSNRQCTNAKEAASELKATGRYDGAILRDPMAGYKIGLVKEGEIVKVKPVLSLDLECVGFEEAEGEKTGRTVTTLIVKYNGVYSNVGSGVPHALSGPNTVGLIVEVECMGVTADNKLREPRFKGVRHDKKEPDA